MIRTALLAVVIAAASVAFGETTMYSVEPVGMAHSDRT